jgi:hypothetical protein
VFRYWIVTSNKKSGVTSKYSPHTHHKAFENSMLAYRLNHVRGASGVINAARGKIWGDEKTVKVGGEKEYFSNYCF